MIVDGSDPISGSLLHIAQAVAEEVGLDAPGSIVNNADKTATQLHRLINRSGQILAKKNWSILQREHTFSTVASTASYALPSDFERLLDQSLWDRTNYWELRGPLDAKDWQIKKSALVGSLYSSFRIRPDTRVNKFYLDPTPSAVLSMVFEYASTEWVRDSGNLDGKTVFTLDTDVSLISPELIELDVIWRFLARKGFAYAEEKREAEMQIDRAFAEDGGAPVLNMGSCPVPYPNVPESGFG